MISAQNYGFGLVGRYAPVLLLAYFARKREGIYALRLQQGGYAANVGRRGGGVSAEGSSCTYLKPGEREYSADGSSGKMIRVILSKSGAGNG